MGDCITERQCRNYSNIPNDTDVLITHSPAYGMLDYDDGINYGSEDLLSVITLVSPIVHLFGHIHKQHGITSIGTTTFSNGAIMNEDYSKLNQPNILEF